MMTRLRCTSRIDTITLHYYLHLQDYTNIMKCRILKIVYGTCVSKEYKLTRVKKSLSHLNAVRLRIIQKLYTAHEFNEYDLWIGVNICFTVHVFATIMDAYRIEQPYGITQIQNSVQYVYEKRKLGCVLVSTCLWLVTNTSEPCIFIQICLKCM